MCKRDIDVIFTSSYVQYTVVTNDFSEVYGEQRILDSSWWIKDGIMRLCSDKKEEKHFLLYKEIQKGAVAKSYMTHSLLIYN